MKTIHILSTLAALALLAASCTAELDPGQDSPAAMAGAPIAIIVPPPPAFAEVAATSQDAPQPNPQCNPQPATRIAQTDEACQWEAGDMLWLTALFFKDKAAANAGPADVTQRSILKYNGTDWRPLSPQEAEEFGITSLPSFVRQLHWPKEVMEGDNPAMAVSADFWGNGKPDADGIITINPNGELPTTVTLGSSRLTWYYPDDVSPVALDKLNHRCSRLRIPAGYRAELTDAKYFSEYHQFIFTRVLDPIDKIPAQDEDTDVFLDLYNWSTVKLINEKDNITYTYTLPSITDAEGGYTQTGVSYTLTPYSGGTEKPLAPGTYDLLISNEEDLRNFAIMVNKDHSLDGPNGPVLAREAKVLQTANITLNLDWTPIGGEFGFSGRYNGNGHTIENMTITETTNDIQYENGSKKYIYAGLFKGLSNAVVTGVNLRNVSIEIDADNTISRIYAGSIAGEANNSTISLCSATGQVIARGEAEAVYTGGIAGRIMSLWTPASTISRCRATVKVEAITRNTTSSTFAGGIVGENDIFSFILSCEAQGGTITAEGGSAYARAGGIAGSNSASSLIAFCHAENNVHAQNGDENFAGGLIGINEGYLYASYARGDVGATSNGGSNRAGILVGYNVETDRVLHCYGAGTATPANSSNLKEDPDNIVYKRNPAAGEILALMQKHTYVVETLPEMPDLFPTTTLYASPVYGIEPIQAKWSRRAWEQDSGSKYPVIDMKYEGE